jgi:hypothetical protein
MRPRRKRLPDTRAWHEAKLAEGPSGFIRARGAKTWDQLSQMCAAMVADWEKRPAAERLAYAFRNPEDRRP